ncbi:MAG: creatininase family protein [Trueperaceae bacterium]
MKLRTNIWNELRSPEIAGARDAGAVVVVPLGATEQHGSHLPLDTDILSATSVCVRAAELSEEPLILVARVLDVGFSPHHMLHPGTLSLRLETFCAVVRDVVQSVRTHGFEKIIFVNGHGGNAAPLYSIAHQLATEGLPMVYCSYWDLIKAEIESILEGSRRSVGHACEFETSLLMHLRPDSVDRGSAVDESRPPWNPKLLRDPVSEAGAVFPPVFTRDSTGVLGDARSGSADKGRQLFETAAARLAELVKIVAETEFMHERVWRDEVPNREC